LARPGVDGSRRGTLAIEEGSLTFTVEDGERVSVAGRDLERARRLRGTPVLEVRYRREGEGVLVLFYFVEPPLLGETSAIPGPGGRRTHRMAAIRKLRGANRRLRPVVERWARALRELMEA
jgi:hypothetical protein